MAAELQANGFNAVPLDWSTISFVEPPTWIGLAPDARVVATIALQGLGGPPPHSNAPALPPDWFEEEEEVIPPGPEEPPPETETPVA